MKIRISRTDWVSSLEAVRATRAAVGEDVAIMADLNQWWRMAGDLSPALDETQVRRIAAELAELGVFWLEEPLPGGDLDGMRALRRQIRVAGGEMARTPAELLDALAAGALDVLQPDVVLAVGMLRTRTIAELALLRHRWFTPHTWTNGLGLLANLHVVAGVGGGPYVEFPYDPPGWTPERRDFFLTEPVRIDAEGYLAVPDAPGLGASIDHAGPAQPPLPDPEPSQEPLCPQLTGLPSSRSRPRTSASAPSTSCPAWSAPPAPASVVVVTDAALASTPVIATVMTVLADAGLPARLFSGVHPNPTTDDLAAGAEAVAESAAEAAAGAAASASAAAVTATLRPTAPSVRLAPAAPRIALVAVGGGVADRRGQGDRDRRGQPAARPGPGLPRRLRRARPADRGGADHGGDGRGDQRLRRGDRPGGAPHVLRGPRQFDARRRDPRPGADRGPAAGRDRRDRPGRADSRAGVLPVGAPQPVVGRDRAAGDPDDRGQPAAGLRGRGGPGRPVAAAAGRAHGGRRDGQHGPRPVPRHRPLARRPVEHRARRGAGHAAARRAPLQPAGAHRTDGRRRLRPRRRRHPRGRRTQRRGRHRGRRRAARAGRADRSDRRFRHHRGRLRPDRRRRPGRRDAGQHPAPAERGRHRRSAVRLASGPTHLPIPH